MLACFAIAIIPFVPIFRVFNMMDKFQVIVISRESSINNEFKLFCDFNYDNTSETIRLIPEFFKKVSVIVEKKQKTVGQWTFNGKSRTTCIYCNDYDSNNQKEIYLIYYRGDSLFLSGFEPLTGKTIVNDYLITTFGRYLGETDFEIGSITMTDLNYDKYKELVFAINCGYSVTTRKIISMDLHDKSFIQSPPAGQQLLHNLTLFDINGDNEQEFFGNYGVFGNCKLISKSYPLTDTLGWLIVYKSNLKYLFDPFIIGKNPSLITTVPLMTAEGGKIAWYYEYFGNDVDTSYIAISDLKGNLIKKKNVNYNIGNSGSFFTSFPSYKSNQMAHYTSDGIVRIFDENIQITEQYQTYPLNDLFPICWDLNQDGENEYIFACNPESLVIISEDFKHIAKTDLIPEKIEHLISVIQNPHEDALFSLSTNQFDYTLKYRENTIYKFRYILMTGSLLLIFTIFLFIGILFQIIAKHRFETEKRLAKIQITALEKQLNPHFNLNVMNSIGALYENENVEKARHYFGKYAKLLRSMLFLSGQISIPLEEELEFVRNYLDLERLRMNNSFDYQILLEDNVPKIGIPKMLIHNFAENAVKHGIRHLTGKGEIIIRAETSGKAVNISISDNGVGREKAREYSSMSTGKGMEILDETLKLYFSLNHIKITYQITDLYGENGEPAGTKAEMTIPIN